MDVKFGCDCLTSSEVRVLYVQEADLRLPGVSSLQNIATHPSPEAAKAFVRVLVAFEPLRPELTVLRRAVEQHPALQWDDRLRTLAGQEAVFAGCCAKRCEVEAVTLQAFEHVLCFLFAAQGTVTKDDPSDGTSSVRFPPPIGRTLNDLWHSHGVTGVTWLNAEA